VLDEPTSARSARSYSTEVSTSGTLKESGNSSTAIIGRPLLPSVHFAELPITSLNVSASAMTACLVNNTNHFGCGGGGGGGAESDLASMNDNVIVGRQFWKTF
jgi:hypothetical protein